MMCVRALLLAAVFVCAENSNQVLQPLGLEVTEGETAEVTCNHTFTTSDYLAWYQHRPRGFPKLLISGYSSPPDIERLSMFITKDRVSTTLKIRGAGVRDTAVYYCGVRDTVREERGNLNKKRCGEPETAAGVPPGCVPLAPSGGLTYIHIQQQANARWLCKA
ncbi:hypothetical protein NDU88_000020 [Pleurodeles waltl]|uniref:Ig-like domain-containing protein n=1 Tax=Pleurodeles waltl TaxID=8319 RepID=A0AAV7V3Y7_PLEWA|nr:hypothetical protein NDU88_000020 [Pleurodeles waltl]